MKFCSILGILVCCLVRAWTHDDNDIVLFSNIMDRLYGEVLKLQQEFPALEQKLFDHLKAFELKLKSNLNEEVLPGLVEVKVQEAAQWRHLQNQTDQHSAQISELYQLIASQKGCKSTPLANPSFETSGRWGSYRRGYQIVSNEAYDGTHSAKVTNGGGYQTWTFEKPIRKLVFTGWSKNVGGPSPSPQVDYMMYCEPRTPAGVQYHGSRFKLNSDWNKATLVIDLEPSLAFNKVTCYFMYKDVNQGVAYFDNLSAYVVSDDVTDPSICARNLD